MSQVVRAEAAEKVAVALFTSEAALEQALAETATVLATLPAVRAAAGLSVFHGQQAIEDGMEVAALLTQARAERDNTVLVPRSLRYRYVLIRDRTGWRIGMAERARPDPRTA